MKLNTLHEQGHWQTIGGHPGNPQKKSKKPRQMSFFVKPPTKDRLEKFYARRSR